MIKVTVCITTYNVESYIEQTLNSILDQKTSFDFEILVGDDCSTDNTRSILLRYKEQYPNKITLYFQQKNVGVCRNDYDLIHMAKGKYIAWCDGDDYWCRTDKLEKQVYILEHNTSLSCVHTAWVNYYEDSNKFEDQYLQPEDWTLDNYGINLLERFLKTHSAGIRYSSIVFRKDILLNFWKQDYEYLSVPHKHNDFIVFCVLAYTAPIYLWNEITVVYRVRKESLSMTQSAKKRFLYSLAFLHLLVYIIRRFSIPQTVAQISVKTSLSSLLSYLYYNKSNEYLQEIKNLCNSINYHYTFKHKVLMLLIQYRISIPYYTSLV